MRGRSSEMRGQSGEMRGQSSEMRGQSSEMRGQSREMRGTYFLPVEIMCKHMHLMTRDYNTTRHMMSTLPTYDS